MYNNYGLIFCKYLGSGSDGIVICFKNNLNKKYAVKNVKKLDVREILFLKKINNSTNIYSKYILKYDYKIIKNKHYLFCSCLECNLKNFLIQNKYKKLRTNINIKRIACQLIYEYIFLVKLEKYKIIDFSNKNVIINTNNNEQPSIKIIDYINNLSNHNNINFKNNVVSLGLMLINLEIELGLIIKQYIKTKNAGTKVEFIMEFIKKRKFIIFENDFKILILKMLSKQISLDEIILDKYIIKLCKETKVII